MRPDDQVGQHQRSDSDRLAIDEHMCASRRRVDLQRAHEPCARALFTRHREGWRRHVSARRLRRRRDGSRLRRRRPAGVDDRWIRNRWGRMFVGHDDRQFGSSRPLHEGRRGRRGRRELRCYQPVPNDQTQQCAKHRTKGERPEPSALLSAGGTHGARNGRGPGRTDGRWGRRGTRNRRFDRRRSFERKVGQRVLHRLRAAACGRQSRPV